MKLFLNCLRKGLSVNNYQNNSALGSIPIFQKYIVVRASCSLDIQYLVLVKYIQTGKDAHPTRLLEYSFVPHLAAKGCI